MNTAYGTKFAIFAANEESRLYRHFYIFDSDGRHQLR